MENRTFPEPVWEQDLLANTESSAAWLMDGFVAFGNLTLLTSQWKAGKTTLVTMLLNRRKEGGSLAGLTVQPGKTVIITEEPKQLWADRSRRVGFGNKVCFFPQPFRTIPRPDEWQALIAQILQLREQHGIDLLVIDPLAHFLRSENSSQVVLESLMPLRVLTARDMAVLVLHHPGRGARAIGQAARGSGALLGHADIIIEMRHPGGDPLTRRRRFVSLSRHSQSPPQMLLELKADGSDYVPVPETSAEDFSAQWNVLRMVLEDAPQKLTRRDILLEWPEDFEPPNTATLARWLHRAKESQQIVCDGTGRKADPFRYCLPEKEADWLQDPLYQEMEKQRIQLKLPFQPLHPSDERSNHRDTEDTERTIE